MNKLLSFCDKCYWFEGREQTPHQCEACIKLWKKTSGLNRGLFEPKREVMEMKKDCYNCDYHESMEWNNTRVCPKGTPYCSPPSRPVKWELQRDKRSCENCYYTNEDEYYPTCKVCNLNDQNDGWSVENWTPEQEPKQEKQMKEYKVTSKCTLKNIIKKIGDTNCDEARIEFFRFFYGLIRHDINISKKNFNSVITNGSLYFDRLTKTEKRRNWLSDHGFIEEEIKYKSYTIDYMSYILNIKTKVEFNGYIDDEDEDTLFFKLDNGKAFNIDKDLITNIKPKTPF